MINGIKLGDVLVDCDDDQRLREFYAELLGWERCELYGLPAVRSETGIVLLFCREEDYVPPVWPEQTGAQQKQMHFDLQVPDLQDAVHQAKALGASQAEAQFGGNHFVTMLDPAGHPFCLCASN